MLDGSVGVAPLTEKHPELAPCVARPTFAAMLQEPPWQTSDWSFSPSLSVSAFRGSVSTYWFGSFGFLSRIPFAFKSSPRIQVTLPALPPLVTLVLPSHNPSLSVSGL